MTYTDPPIQVTAQSDNPPNDSWLTVSEFADELRVRPVTVRSWITKGELSATRAGQRKWLIRRSELYRMLDDDPASSPPPEVDQAIAEVAVAEARERDALDEAEASYEWQVALEQSRMAPPDARFVARLRHIAQAADWRGAAIRDCLDDPDYRWKPREESAEMTLSYELRPGGNRPGSKDLWEQFDRIVARLGKAMAATSAAAVADALTDLARVMRNLSDAIEQGPSV